MQDYLKVEDYAEPNCPLCMGDERKGSIDIQRVISKLEEYLSKNDYQGAKRHLLYWKEEAVFASDDRGLLSIENELMGLNRKIGDKNDAYDALDNAQKLLAKLDMQESIGGATTYLNSATVYKAFGEADKAIELYNQAEQLYAKYLSPDDARWGGLYNNMALALADLKDYGKARICYQKALDIMKNVPNGELEQAITYLNIANVAEWEKGILDAESEIDECIQKAENLLKTPTLPHNGYYAFVLEKCAPTFAYYGYFGISEEFKTLSEKIYERS